MSDAPLCERKCVPCEGGVPTVERPEAETLVEQLDQWQLTDDALAIYRKFKFANFKQALDFCNAVGELAEAEQHHPDLHLTGYRHVRIDLTTHAIGGLSENDFILAAKIDTLSRD